MDHSKLKPEAYFDLGSFQHAALFSDCRWVWDGLAAIKGYLKQRLHGDLSELGCFRQPLPRTVVLWRGRVWHEGFELLGGDVTKATFRLQIRKEEVNDAVVLYAGSVLWDEQILIGPGSVVEPGALIQGPTLIGAHTEVRQGAYIRGNCLIGDRCVVGHTTEIKASIMFDDAKAGHFAYIGDSILGNATNLGAGTKLANLRIRPGPVRVKFGSELVDTGLRKFGAVLGDHVEIGCNAVTNPGTLLGKGCQVFPVTSVPSGYHEPESIVR